MPARNRPTKEARDRERLLVEHDGKTRPFMRGILVHSLMARGISFDEAHAVANTIRDELRERQTITRDQLAERINHMLKERDLLADAQQVRSPRIDVRGQGGDAPFSKGFLSQSLLAAAIDPNAAFEVASEIEMTLRARRVTSVDRRELRRIAYETLKQRFGESTAERYLVWRRFQDPDRPVILLLGGATGSGKTSLAVEVAHRMGIHRVLSTDSIRQVMRIMLSKELVPAIHASSYDAHEYLADDTLGDEPVLSAFETQASTVSVGVQAILDRAVEENASLILDGVSIVPGMIDLERYRGSAHVIYLLVATLDPGAFRARFEARARHSQRKPHRYLPHLDSILRIQDHLLELADRHNVPIVDNDARDLSVLSIIKHVTGTLRKAEEFDVEKML